MTRRFAGLGWLALLIAGQAAALHLVQAGHSIGYQHYRLSLTGLTDLAAAFVLVTQAVAVVLGLRRHAGPLHRQLRALLTPLALLLVGIALLGLAATASKEPRQYVVESLLAIALQASALGTIVLFALAIPAPPAGRARGWLHRLIEPDNGDDLRPASLLDGFSVTLAVLVTAAATLLVLLSYDRHPHVPDEVVYLLHAKYFAAGRLSLPVPPVPAAFDIDLMSLEAHRWYSPVPPGWPAVLAIGAFFHVPWLVDPVLGGLNVLLVYALLTGIYSRRVARLATILFAASPWSLFLAMSFMTHTVTLTFALLAALGVSRARIAGRPRLGLLFAAGCAIGAVSLVRPLEGFAVALLLGFWSLPIRGRWFRLSPSVALGTGAVVTGALVLPYNAAMTGRASVFPINLYVDTHYIKGSNDLGFGANRGLGWSGLDPFPGHGPIDVVVNADLNATTINFELLGWATGSLIAVFFLLARGRLRRADWWMLVAIAMIAGIHSFYWFSGGPDFGARYWFLVVVPLIALSARGVEELGRALTTTIEHTRSSASPEFRFDRGSGARVAIGALALTLASCLCVLPWRAIDKYHNYRGMRADIRRFLRDGTFGNGVVLVRGRRHPDYASAAAYNPLDLRTSGPVFAWDVSPGVRREIAVAYPDRQLWFVEGPSVTHDGYRVVAGPLPSADVARGAGPP